MPAVVTIQIRRGTASAWTTANPVLAVGELGLETDTLKLKAGDGSTTWNSLSYLPGGASLDATGTDIQPLGTQAAGSKGLAADAGHVHAMPRHDQVLAPTAAVSWGSQQLNLLANGVVSTDAVNLGQVQALFAGLQPAEAPAKGVAVANVATLSGPQTVNSVALVAGDRELLTAQSTASQNGLWVVNSGGWTRPTDFATGSNAQGKLVGVENGTVWLLPSTTTITVDTTSQTWMEIDSSVIAAGTGLSKSGNSLSVTYGTGAGTAAQGNDSRFTTYTGTVNGGTP